MEILNICYHMLMDFILNIKDKKITNQDILLDLRKVFSKLKYSSLAMKDYDEQGKYSSSLVSRRFGSWNNALKQANIPCKQEFWKVDDLMTNLYSVWVRKGRQPARRDMDDKTLSKISSGAYLRKYGSWYNALRTFANYMKKSNSPRISATEKKKVSHRTKRDINLRLRFLVMKRDNFKCVVCGRSPASSPNIELHVDHIIPYSKGGETILDNLQTLCADCNLGKGNMTDK